MKFGKNFISGPQSIILAHDSAPLNLTGKRYVTTTTIGDDVFLGAAAIVLAGVTRGNRVIIGAGSVVAKDVPDNSVVAGNPARVICTVDEYLKKHRRQAN